MAYVRSRSLNALREARCRSAFDDVPVNNLLLGEAHSRATEHLLRSHPSIAAGVRREIQQGIRKFHDGAYGSDVDSSQKKLAEDVHRALTVDREGLFRDHRDKFSNISVAVGPVAYDGTLPAFSYKVAYPKKAAFGDQNAWVTVFHSPQDDLRLSPRCMSPRQLSPRQLSPRQLSPRQLSPRQMSAQQLSARQLSPGRFERDLYVDSRSPVFAPRSIDSDERTYWPVGCRSATTVTENRLGDKVESRSFTDAYGDRITTRMVVDKYGDVVKTTSTLDPTGNRVQTKTDTSTRMEGPLRREVELRTLVNNKSVDDLWMDRFRTRTYQDRLSNDIYGLSRPVFRDDALARRSASVLGY